MLPKNVTMNKDCYIEVLRDHMINSTELVTIISSYKTMHFATRLRL